MFKNELEEMFIGFAVENNAMFNVYYKKLKNSGADENELIYRIKELSETWQPEYGRKIPSVSEILGYKKETKENAELENAWKIFLETKCYNYANKPMPDWVFTIKNRLGIQRVEDATEDDLVWIRKDFDKIFPMIKAGFVAIDENPNKYIQIGNITMLESEINKANEDLQLEYKAGNYKQLSYEAEIKQIGYNDEH